MFFTQTDELVLGKHNNGDCNAVERYQLNDVMAACGGYWAAQLSAMHALLVHVCEFMRAQREEKQFALMIRDIKKSKYLQIYTRIKCTAA